MQTFLNFNNTATSNAQAIQQELPSIFSSSDARAVEGLTVTATLFTALALVGFIVSARASRHVELFRDMHSWGQVLTWGQRRMLLRAGGGLLANDHLSGL